VIFINFNKLFDNFVSKIPFFHSPEKIFLLVGFFFGIVFIVLTPPFQVADESSHFLKAYENSELKNFGINGTDGDFLPASLSVTISQVQDRIPFHYEKKYDIEKTFTLINFPLNPSSRQFTQVMGFYPPSAYLPQIVAISLGKLLNWSPLALMYLGRLFNFCVWLILIYLTIRITPVGKWVFLVLALTPMSLFQAASLSQDAFINGIAFLLIGFLLFLAFDKNKKNVTVSDMLILIAFLVILSLSKQVYSSIGLLFFLVPLNKFKNTKDFILKFSILIGTIIIINAFWQYLTKDLLRSVVIGYGFNLESQLSFIIHNPINFFFTILNTLYVNKHFYLNSFIGILGWLDTGLPDYIYILGLGLLIFISVVDNEDDKHLPLRQKGIICLIIFTSILGIFTGMYLIWNSTGANIVNGVSGRYFIPISPLLFLLLYNNKVCLPETQKNYAKLITVFFVIFILWVAIQYIFKRYYSSPLPLWLVGGLLICIICVLMVLSNFLFTKKEEEVRQISNGNSKKENLTFILLILLFFSLILILLVCTGSKLGISQTIANQPVGEIYGKNIAGQTFYSSKPDMNSINVLLATYHRNNTRNITFHLRDSPDSKKDIESFTVNARQIRDNSYYKFEFPPIKNSVNQSYYFFIESPDSSPGDAITIWSSKEDTYPDGTAYLNSIPVRGDLSFNIYYIPSLFP
jgi:uncharacterized membrane protein